MRKWLIPAVLVLAAVLAWVAAGPWLTMTAIGKAVREENHAALARHVDFPPLRASLKAQLGDRLARSVGIERQAGVKEPEDHAAALCDTMTLLILGEEPASLEQQHEFFARHIEPWMGRFFRDLQKADSAHFYRAVGQLGEQFIGVESAAFGVSIPAAGTTTPN